MKSALRIAAALAMAAATAAMAGCGSRREPVAELQVAPAEVRLDYPRFVPVAFTWKLLAPPPAAASAKPTVFVHLREKGGEVARTFDHFFPADWQPGTTVRDQVLLYQSALGPALPPGSYQLTVGLYDASGRWEVAAPGDALDRAEYAVARVEIGAEAAGAPSFSFSESWWPQEPGEDAQVLASRWLAGEGTVRVSGTSEAGTVWMRMRLPEANVPGVAAVPGGSPPALAISNGCAATEMAVSGAGTHDLSVAVPAGAAGAGCEIVLRSNATDPGATGRARSVLLEILAWGAPSDSAALEAPAPPASAPR